VSMLAGEHRLVVTSARLAAYLLCRSEKSPVRLPPASIRLTTSVSARSMLLLPSCRLARCKAPRDIADSDGTFVPAQPWNLSSFGLISQHQQKERHVLTGSPRRRPPAKPARAVGWPDRAAISLPAARRRKFPGALSATDQALCAALARQHAAQGASIQLADRSLSEQQRSFRPSASQLSSASSSVCAQSQGGTGRGCCSSAAVTLLLAADPETCGVIHRRRCISTSCWFRSWRRCCRRRLCSGGPTAAGRRGTAPPRQTRCGRCRRRCRTCTITSSTSPRGWSGCTRPWTAPRTCSWLPCGRSVPGELKVGHRHTRLCGV